MGAVTCLLLLSWGCQSSAATMGCWKSAFPDVCQTGVSGANGELLGVSKIPQPMGMGRSGWVLPMLWEHLLYWVIKGDPKRAARYSTDGR